MDKGNSDFHFTSAQLIPLGFLFTILLGSFLLVLPISTADGQHTDFLTALFTATTSVCVTGLVVVDTYAHWSLFGKIIILMLIQIGGMGIVMVSSMLLILLGQKLSIKDRVLIKDSFNLDSIQGMIRFMRKVALGIFVIEMCGMLLYLIYFIPEFGLKNGIWYAFFNSVSAFCNAGMDIIGPNSMMPYHSNVLVLTVTMALIVLGGLGYIVWFNLMDVLRRTVMRRKGIRYFFHHLNEHTKLVLSMTVFLILSGALIVFVLEYFNSGTIGKMTFGDKILNSFFQSVTLRTAGFVSVPQQDLREITSFIGCIYMFIGGSPMGTAGGIKTISFFALFLNAMSVIRDRKDAVVFGRTFSRELIEKATAITTISLTVTLVLTVLLAAVEDLPLIDAMYEMFSATGTVGLSRAVTPALGPAGRLLDICGMYLGRIGPISMAIFFHSKTSKKNEIRYATGKYFVG